MIVLTQNSINQVTVSLTEKQLGTGSLYLLQLVNQETKGTIATVLQDVSDDRMSYNTFYIPVSSSGFQDTGSLVLPLTGEYYYTFYEGTGSISPTSSIGLNVVETGIVQLITNVSSSTSYFTASLSPTSVFNPADYGIN